MAHVVNTGGQNQGVASMLIRDVPDELHQRLRVAAAFKGESLSALGLRAVEREIERVETEMERDRAKRKGSQ